MVPDLSLCVLSTDACSLGWERELDLSIDVLNYQPMPAVSHYLNIGFPYLTFAGQHSISADNWTSS